MPRLAQVSGIDFHAYIRMKRRDGEWGDDLEIQSMCEIYNEVVNDLLSDPKSRPIGGLKVKAGVISGIYEYQQIPKLTSGSIYGKELTFNRENDSYATV